MCMFAGHARLGLCRLSSRVRLQAFLYQVTRVHIQHQTSSQSETCCLLHHPRATRGSSLPPILHLLVLTSLYTSLCDMNSIRRLNSKQSASVPMGNVCSCCFHQWLWDLSWVVLHCGNVQYKCMHYCLPKLLCKWTGGRGGDYTAQFSECHEICNVIDVRVKQVHGFWVCFCVCVYAHI